MAGSKGGATLIERSQIHRHLMLATMFGSYLQYVIGTPRPLARQKTEEDTAIAVKMLYLSCQLNELRNLIETEGIHRRLFTWAKLVASGVAPEFPKLSEVEIREITLRTYQVKMAKSYIHEHIDADVSY